MIHQPYQHRVYLKGYTHNYAFQTQMGGSTFQAALCSLKNHIKIYLHPSLFQLRNTPSLTENSDAYFLHARLAKV